METNAIDYRGYRFPREIISHGVWLYHRKEGEAEEIVVWVGPPRSPLSVRGMERTTLCRFFGGFRASVPPSNHMDTALCREKRAPKRSAVSVQPKNSRSLATD
jgi:hypothetical protein